MTFLTEDQRTKALELLKKAPDEIILGAMVDLRRYRHMEDGTRRNFDEVCDELSERRTHDEPVSVEHRGSAIVVNEVEEITIRANVSPGTPLIGKIGTATKEELLKLLGQGICPAKKYAEHLKLLWSRNEVKYDGEVFYL